MVLIDNSVLPVALVMFILKTVYDLARDVRTWRSRNGNNGPLGTVCTRLTFIESEVRLLREKKEHQSDILAAMQTDIALIKQSCGMCGPQISRLAAEIATVQARHEKIDAERG